MKIKLLGLVTMLMFLFNMGTGTNATTYTIQNPLGSLGTIWFPALTPSNISNGGVGGIGGVIVTDGTLGPLSAQNIVDFQIGVNALTSTNSWSSDISAPVRSGTGTVTIDGTALFATPLGLFSTLQMRLPLT